MKSDINITNFIQWIFSETIRILTWSYTLLDSIKIWGTITMLDLIITIFVITIMLPIILTLAKGQKIRESKSGKIKKGEK